VKFNDYQEKAWGFALPTAKNFAYVESGLVGEVGELFSLFAKATRDGPPEDYLLKVKKELGDVLWFVAAMCTMHGLHMEDIAGTNIDKLENRRKLGTISGQGDDR